MDLFLPLLCLVITLWLYWRWRTITTFQKLGIPGPPPGILFGNLVELFRKGPLQCHEEWVKKYGRVLGYYVGMTPTLLITDPHLLKNIFIKDFAKFMNREAFSPIGKYSKHDKFSQSVLNLPGEEWKNVRSILTPTFTTAKMKQMSKGMQMIIQIMMDIMAEFANKGVEFDVFDVYQRLTLDVISRTAFGVKTDVQTNMKSQLLKATKLIFHTPYRNPFIFFGLSFPLLRKVCLRLQNWVVRIKFLGRHPFTFLRNGIIKVLELRRKNPSTKNSDFLQIMIDNAVTEETGNIDLSQLEAGNTENEQKTEEKENSAKRTRGMTDDEIISTALVVILAGYETTSTALGYTTYFLAKNQDVQQKLYEEIDALYKTENTFEYLTVNRLQYLDKVLCESLRLFPPIFLFTNRYALEEVQYGDITIPKGMLIRAPTYQMHHDPELWENPEVFDPERFSEKPNSNGITYLPFGVGPRNCLGMRFAQMEAKLVLAYVIHKFRIFIADVHKENLPLSIRIRSLAPTEGIQIRLEERN